MKPTENQLLQFIAIYADDKKGLLAQILMYFNRKDYPVYSLNVARMDLQDVVLVILEVFMTRSDIKTILKKIDNIIEVYKSMTFQLNEVNNLKVGLFKLGIASLNNAMWSLLQQQNAAVCCMSEDSVLIRKTGTEKDLKQLYERLEGPHLLAFCQSSLVAPEALLLTSHVYQQK